MEYSPPRKKDLTKYIKLPKLYLGTNCHRRNIPAGRNCQRKISGSGGSQERRPKKGRLTRKNRFSAGNPARLVRQASTAPRQSVT